MQLQYVSDVHLNFQVRPNHTSASALASSLWTPTPCADHLIILGDIWEGDRLFKYGPDHFSWVAHVAKLYKTVYLIMGNHDIYGSFPAKMVQKWQQHIHDQQLHNVVLLDNTAVELAPGLFLHGGVGWSDIKRAPGNLIAYYTEPYGYAARPYYTDFSYIKVNDSKKCKPHDWQQWHDLYLSSLKTHLSTHQGATTVVASHMPMVDQSLENMPPEADSTLTQLAHCMDASPYSELLLQYDVPVHLHGHLHQVLDYTIQKLAVKANPLGYYGHTQNGKDLSKLKPFDPCAIISL